MKVKTNPDFKKWVTTLTTDQKKFNLNKVYKVLRRVDKEDKFRHCVKQFAIDWQVNVTRLTEEQLKPYLRESNQTDASSSSTTEPTNEEDWAVLDKRINDDNTTGDASQNVSFGKESDTTDTSPDDSLPRGETLQNSQEMKEGLQNENDCDYTCIRLHTETENTSNKKFEYTHPFHSPFIANLPMSNARENSIHFTAENNQSYVDDNILSHASDYEKFDNLIGENELSHKGNINIANGPKEILSEEMTPEVSTLYNISKNNVETILEEDSFVDNNSIHDTLFDNSRNEAVMKNNIFAVLPEENPVDTKSSVVRVSKLIENKDFVEDIKNQHHLISLKHIRNYKKGVEEKEIFPDESCFSVDGDFESAARGLEEALQTSEEDVTSLKTGPKIKKVKSDHSCVGREHLELHEPILRNKTDENNHLAKGLKACVQAINDTICRDDKCLNPSACQIPFSIPENFEVKSSVFSDCEQNVQGLFDKTPDESSIDLQYSASSSNHEERYQEEINARICNDTVKITSSNILSLPENSILDPTSTPNYGKSVTDDKANSTKKITVENQNSQVEKEMSLNRTEEVVIEEYVNTDIPVSSYSEKPQAGKADKQKISQKKLNLALSSKQSKTENFHCCIPKESRYFNIENNRCKEVGNTVNNFDSCTELRLSYDEKSVVDHWWTKYHHTFSNEKTCHSLHYSEGVFDYDYETWPYVSFELKEKYNKHEEIHFEPTKLRIDCLLSEIEDLEREKNIISSLQENTSECELEAAEYISDDENILPVSEIQETTHCVPFLVSTSNVIRSIATSHKGNAKPLQDNKLSNPPPEEPPIQPPLPSYPPPRTPSPPPIPSLSVEVSQPGTSCSLPSLVMPSNLQKEESNCIFNIPLPPSAPFLTSSKIKKSKPQNLNIVEPPTISELSSLIKSPLNEQHHSQNLDSQLDSASLPENKLAGLHHEPKKTDSVPQKYQGMPLLNSELRAVTASHVLPFNETPLSKESSVLYHEGTSKSGPILDLGLSKEELPATNTASMKSSVETPLLSVAASTSGKLGSLFPEEPLLQPSLPPTRTLSPPPIPAERNITDIVCFQKLSQNNVTKEEQTSDISLDRSNVTVSRNKIRERNLYFVKCWKSVVKYTNINMNMKKPRIPKSYKRQNIKFSNNVRNVLQNEVLSLRVKETLTSSKLKLDRYKKNDLYIQLCHKTNNADSTLPFVGEVNDCSPRESDKKSDSKREFHLENYNSLLSHTLCEVDESTSDDYITPRKVVDTEKEQTCKNAPVEKSEYVHTSLATYNIEEGLVPTIVSVMSTATNNPQSSPEMRKFENEDNNSWQFVDESIPGDPIACKYVEDEENIEILFEPVTNNSSNPELKIENTTLSLETPDTELSSSLMKLDVPNDDCTLYDLENSSTDNESEEECYTRPRIIKGFGDPFIIPRSEDENISSILASGSENAPSPLKIEGMSKFPSDNILETNILLKESVFEKMKNERAEASSVSLSSGRSNQSLSKSNNAPDIVDDTSIANITFEKSHKKRKDSKSVISNKQRKSPLKPKNQVVPAIKASEKQTERFSTSKDKIIRRNEENYKELNVRKQNPGKSTTKINSVECRKYPQISGNIEPFVNKRVIQNKPNKTKSLINSKTEATNCHFQLTTHVRTGVKKVNVETSNKNNQKASCHGLPPNKTIEKEKAAYQPSTIRKKLASEVENIIPIKKDGTKFKKPQIRNESVPLKRTNSLPEDVPSEKAVNPVSDPSVNPVLDSIFKDMDATPPPKSLVIKEPETQKYVAEAYWFNSTSNNNHTNARESYLPNNGLKNQATCTTHDRQSANKYFKTTSVQSNKTFKRSVSLNSESIGKKENTHKSHVKPGETVSYVKKCFAKTSSRPKISEISKSACSNKYLILNDERAKNQGIPPKDESNLVTVNENLRTKKSLPSMPSIEFENNSDSLTEKRAENNSDSLTEKRAGKQTACKTKHEEEACKVIKLSTNIQSNLKSDFENSTPSLKVSLPIFHFNFLFGEKNKTRRGVHNGTYFKKKNKKINGVGNERGTPERSNDQKHGVTQDNECLNNGVVLNKLQIGHKYRENPAPNGSEQNSHDVTSGNSRSSRKNNNSKVLQVRAQKELKPLCEDESVTQSRNCMKRSSSESKSESPTKFRKLSPPGLDDLDTQHKNVPLAVETSIVPPSDPDEDIFPVSNQKHSSKNGLSTFGCSTIEDNPTNLKRCRESENNIIISHPFGEGSIKIFKDLTLNNELQKSKPQDPSSEGDVSHCITTTFDSEDARKSESLTLRVKHPSFLQSQRSENVGLDHQHQPRRRISVLSPEVLSSGVQTNDLGNVKRHTWYMEPENISCNSPLKQNHDTKDSQCKITSLFSNLFIEPNVKTKLKTAFETSAKIGKKEYEKIHDVIRCIELDYKQKQNVIECVKKLQSRDVVKQEIKRATTEYEKKLAERESYFRKTFANLLDHFKDATGYIHLAFYVFLTQKVEHLCSETALRDRLLTLLKSWIRNDWNKHIFDQDDIAFSNDCDIVLKILKEIDNFPLLLSGVGISAMNNPAIYGKEDDETNFSLQERNSQMNRTNTLLTSNAHKDAVTAIESDVFSTKNKFQGMTEQQNLNIDSPQVTSLSLGLLGEEGKMSSLQSIESYQLLSEISRITESGSSVSTSVSDDVSNLFGNTASTQSQMFSLNSSGSPSNIGLPIPSPVEVTSSTELRINVNQTCSTSTSALQNELFVSSQEISRQVPYFGPQNSDYIPNVIDETQQPHFLTQPDSQQVQELSNIRNVNSDRATSSRQNKSTSEVSRENLSSSINRTQHRYQIQNEPSLSNHPLSPLFSQTNATIDKYQNMRQRCSKSNMINHSTDSVYMGCNSSLKTVPSVARHSLVENESSTYSLPCNQNIEACVFGVHSGTSQPEAAPLAQPIFLHLQNVQTQMMHQHPRDLFNQTTETEKVAQRSQPSYQQFPHTNLRSGLTLQPTNNCYPVQPSQNQVAQYVMTKNTPGQLNQRNLSLAQSSSMYANQITNPQPVECSSVNSSNCNQPSNQLHSQNVYLPYNRQQNQFSSNRQRLMSQELQWQNIYPPQSGNQLIQRGGKGKNMSSFPKEQNISYVVNMQNQVCQTSFNIRNKDGTHPLNISPNTTDTRHITSQIMQNDGQSVSVQSMPPRRLINNNKLKQSTKRPLKQMSPIIETQKRKYLYQHNPRINQFIGSRRPSVQTTQSSLQINTNPSSNNGLSSTLTSDKSMNSQSQRQSVYFNGIEYKTLGHIESRRKSSELSDQIDLSGVTEADLNNLFSQVDDKTIEELMRSIEDSNVTPAQANYNSDPAATNNQSLMNNDTPLNDGTIQSALFIQKLPDSDSNFNGVDINKDELHMAGLTKNQDTPFISEWTTAGDPFTQNESMSLMKEVTPLDVQRVQNIDDFEKKRSKLVLIQTLKATAFKDVASYIRIIDILKRLAKNDKDAQQAVQEMIAVVRFFRQSEQVDLSNPVIVIDD